ncbi:MAG: alkaline phosphatase D family protein, partial [Dermabacteraceae bacterium]
MPSTGAPRRLSRRRLFQFSGASAALIALGIDARAAHADPLSHRENLFALGIASGALRPGGMALWTCLAPEPLAEDGHGDMPLRPVIVGWEVATDEEFTSVVARGKALAQPELAHAVHHRVEGLDPAHFYRVRAGKQTSPVGRFRTLPAEGVEADSFSIGVVSCQAWYHGHFTAHRHLAAEEEL